MQTTQPITKIAGIELGDTVKRDLGTKRDSCNGRIGEVIEINANGRVRVRWTHEATGEPITKSGKVQPVRTWVDWKTLKKQDVINLDK